MPNPARIIDRLIFIISNKPMNDNNSTTNAILVILLVLVVGFIVWFVMGRDAAPVDDGGANIQVDLNGGGDNNGGTGTTN
jgi:hypothetical protein